MSKDYQRVLGQVLRFVVPNDSEKKKITSLAKRTLAVANEEARKINAHAMLTGSLTRDTWLSGKKEFDVFILFPPIDEKKLEELGLQIGKNIIKKMKGNYRIDYAQHPYVCGLIDGIDVDIVPCFEVKSCAELKSAVDRSPFHVKYIEKHLSAKKANDVRLLKQFCTANGIYGADAKTEGYSGYVCELLVINYGGFLDVLRAVSNWEPGEVIDIGSFYAKTDHHILQMQFKEQPLILIDPTDKTRNTAAAVSAQSFLKLKKLAKEFLDKPDKKMFLPKKFKSITENELMMNQLHRRTELVLVKFKPPEVVPDILWPQMRKFAERLQSILEEVKYEFKVLRKGVYSNEKDLAAVLLEMEVSKLPRVQKRVGPKIFDRDDSKRFLEKHKGALTGPFVEDNFWAVEIERKFLTAREKLEDSLKENVETLKAKGVPPHIAEEVAKKFEIISSNEEMMKIVRKDANFGVFLKQYFEKESLV